MRRLYYLLPDIDTAKKVVDELLLKRIDDHHIHVIAREGVPVDNLPEANLLQKSDFIPAIERGLAIGGVTGILAGIAAVTVPGEGMALGGEAILLSSLAGAAIGAWVSGMIGLDVHNSQISRFDRSIQDGKVLLMVDVRRERTREVNELVREHHPNAQSGGEEPHIPAFP